MRKLIAKLISNLESTDVSISGILFTELSIKDLALARAPVGVVSCMQVPR